MRTAPTCQSCGAIRPPSACTASVTSLPGRQLGLAVEAGNVGIVEAGGAGDAGAFGDDQPDLGLRPPA